MMTVAENQHVQNQHIISPVSLQLATTTQTYSLFFQPLAKFGFYHLLAQPSTVHTLSQLPPQPQNMFAHQGCHWSVTSSSCLLMAI